MGIDLRSAHTYHTTMRTLNLLLAITGSALLSSCSAQMKNARTVTVHVNGDCGMCEPRIEKAAYVKGEAEADWDVDAKTARITYDSVRTTLDAVLKRIAEAGYDSEKFLAPDAAYAALPGCCQYERTDKHATVDASAHDHAAMGSGHHHGHSEGDHHQEGAAATSQTDTTKHVMNEKADQLKPLFDAYFALKNALVASDATAAAARADDFTGAWHSIQMERMTPEVHGVWMRVMEALENTGHAIAATKDLEKQRAGFAELGEPMLALVKVAPRTEPVYLDHCPMFNGGADWLSKDRAIKNPFYGSMMLTCGSVKQTIP